MFFSRPFSAAAAARRICAIAAGLLVISGCANFPYKIEIRQGNESSLEKRGQLQIGMSAADVRAMLGTPQTITFRDGERWHYIFRRHTAGALSEDRRLTLTFQEQRLAGIEESAPLPPAENSQAAEEEEQEANPPPDEADDTSP